MSSTAVVTITASEPSASLIARLNKSGKHSGVQALVTLLEGISGGTVDGKVELAMGAIAASGAAVALTYASVAANDTVTIGGTVITAKASGADGTTQFNKQTDGPTTAANLAACINANATISTQVTALAVASTVTLTAIHEGAEGNLIVLATSNGTGFGLTQFSGGSDGTTKTYAFGIA